MGTYLCDSCAMKLTRAPRTCHYCGGRATLGLTHPGCRRKRGIDGEICLYTYEPGIARVLHEAKYQGAWRLLVALCNYASWKDTYDVHVWRTLFNPTIVPVPLHKHKTRQRGFNQSDIIARQLLGYVKPEGPLLVRWKENGPQASIKEVGERRQNVRGIFSVPTRAPETVLLVDDVITTGSTIEECARALKRAGTQRVLALSVAKG